MARVDPTSQLGFGIRVPGISSECETPFQRERKTKILQKEVSKNKLKKRGLYGRNYRKLRKKEANNERGRKRSPN
jgi:hypothetical protein